MLLKKKRNLGFSISFACCHFCHIYGKNINFTFISIKVLFVGKKNGFIDDIMRLIVYIGVYTHLDIMKKIKRLLVLALLGYGLCSCASVFNTPFTDSYQKRIGTYQKAPRSQTKLQPGTMPMPSPAASIGGNASNADFGRRQNDFFWATRNFPQ